VLVLWLCRSGEGESKLERSSEEDVSDNDDAYAVYECRGLAPVCVSVSLSLVIIIIIDVFKVAQSVKTIARTTVLGWEIMTGQGECNRKSNSFVTAAEQYVFSLFLNTDSDEVNVTSLGRLYVQCGG